MRQSFDSSARAIPTKGWAAGLILVLVGLGSALCYAAALMRFPLLAIYAQPIQNIEKLTHADPRVGLALTGWTLLVFAGYAIGAVVLARDARRSQQATVLPVTSSTRHIVTLIAVLVGFPLLFLALLALVYPTTSVDLYDYMFRGRMLAQYQANTFTQVPIEFKADPLFWYVAWRKAVTAYGPLWEGMSWLTARLAGEYPDRLLYGQEAQYQALLHLMLAYKGLSALGFLGCGAAIWVTLRRTAFEWRWLGLYLWLWNPLALWESLAAGHNDAWMAMLIVLAVGLLVPRPGDQATRRPGDHVSGSSDLLVALYSSIPRAYGRRAGEVFGTDVWPAAAVRCAAAPAGLAGAAAAGVGGRSGVCGSGCAGLRAVLGRLGHAAELRRSWRAVYELLAGSAPGADRIGGHS